MNNSQLINESTKESLQRLLDLIGLVSPTSDLDKIRDTTVKSLKYASGSSKVREQTIVDQEVENAWYKSLQTNTPYYSVYASDYYLSEAFACWAIYSKNYIKSMKSEKSLPESGGIFQDMGEIKRIVDLGCGIGFTTAALSEIFPNAEVIGTNIEGTIQADIAKKLSGQYHFRIVPDLKQVKSPVDLIFASEYFEHIVNPIDHLFDIIQNFESKAVVVANSFSAKAIGHFDEYMIADEPVKNKKVGRIFNSEMRLHGYSKVETKMWNDRPTYWRLNEF